MRSGGMLNKHTMSKQKAIASISRCEGLLVQRVKCSCVTRLIKPASIFLMKLMGASPRGLSVLEADDEDCVILAIKPRTDPYQPGRPAPPLYSLPYQARHESF